MAVELRGIALGLRVLMPLLGLASLAVGLWWMYPPSALIAVGLLLIAESAVYGVRVNRARREAGQ